MWRDGVICLVCFFFFSSRRRHTRSKRDWSSDVCSSDLTLASRNVDFIGRAFRRKRTNACLPPVIAYPVFSARKTFFDRGGFEFHILLYEIGRASCRERV